MNGTPLQLHLRFIKDSGKQISFTFWKDGLFEVNFEENQVYSIIFSKTRALNG